MLSWFPLQRTATEIARARHIAEVLIRNGLGFVVEITGLTRFLPPWRTRRLSQAGQTTHLSVPQRLRRTLEELGPTFIKLGQVLSTRSDILPQEYIVELSKLLDAAPPVPFAEIRTVVEQELGGSVNDHFQSFLPEPIASASIGQVHRAILLDGTPVVVKVQRPGVYRVVQADLNLLQTQARFLEGRSDTLASYGVTEVVQEFSESLLAELNYTLEGRHAERLRNLTRDENLVIPEIFWSHSTRRILTMSALQGTMLSNKDMLVEQGYDLSQVAEQVIDTYLRQIFEHGIFHADPHPANILVHDGCIGLVDFGMVGYLTPVMRQYLGDLLLNLVRQDADEMVHVISRLGAFTHVSDLRSLRRDLQRLMMRYYDVSLESLPIAEFLGDVTGISFQHHIRLPADLALLARTVVVLEGVIRGLDPSIVLSKYLEPFIIGMVKERVSLKQTVLDSVKTLHDLQQILQVLPRRVDLLTEQLERGEMTLGIDVRRLDQALRRVEAVGNRISFSVIVAAIIMGSALVLLAGEEAAIFRFPFTDIALPIPEIGFLVAGLLGAWWLFSIIRSKGL